MLDEALSLGTLVAFITSIKMFFRPIRDLAEKYNILQNAMSSAERLLLILDSQSTLPKSRIAANLADLDRILRGV